MIRSWNKDEAEKGSHVTEVISDGFNAAMVFGKSLEKKMNHILF